MVSGVLQLMTENVINLDAERNRRSDPASVSEDAQGNVLIDYCASYSLGEDSWMLVVKAYSREDADRRVQAIRSTLKLEGAAFEFEPVSIEPL